MESFTSSYLLDVTIAHVRLRISEYAAGFMVTKVLRGPNPGSCTIRRVRFGSLDAAGVGAHCLTQALEAAEPCANHLRAVAERAARRAIFEKRLGRAGSGSVCQLEDECVSAKKAYLREARRLALECAGVDQLIVAAGFPTGARMTPTWIKQLLDAENWSQEYPRREGAYRDKGYQVPLFRHGPWLSAK